MFKFKYTITAVCIHKSGNEFIFRGEKSDRMSKKEFRDGLDRVTEIIAESFKEDAGAYLNIGETTIRPKDFSAIRFIVKRSLF